MGFLVLVRRGALGIVMTVVLIAGGLKALSAQNVSEKDITKQLGDLRSLPDDKRGPQTGHIALEIRALPAGLRKVQLANGLANLATEGDPGRDNLQEVATTLGQALAETPVPAGKTGKPASAYMELARLVRYEGMKTELTGEQFTAAQAALEQNDADVQKADFSLKDIHGKKVTLSELRGKIVMVNFWATWCPPCRREMPDLNAIYNHFKSQDLVILSISDEDLFKVGPFIAQSGYTYPILLDPGRKVADEFHITGIPKSFVFDREGKLDAEAVDMRTQRQFLRMLAKAGLKLQ